MAEKRKNGLSYRDAADMLRTFNMGVGLVVVAAPAGVAEMREHLATQGYASYECGEIVTGTKNVIFKGALDWNGPPAHSGKHRA